MIALLPFVVFIFVRPGELPARFVSAARLFPSIWYLVSVIALAITIWRGPPTPDGLYVFPIFAAIGLIPCAIVISRSLRRWRNAR